MIIDASKIVKTTTDGEVEIEKDVGRDGMGQKLGSSNLYIIITKCFFVSNSL